MRHLCFSVIVLGTLLSIGCPVGRSRRLPLDVEEQPSDLVSLIDQTLEWNRDSRQLSTEQHGAWQILHGILAYGSELVVATPEGPRPALEHLIEGSAVNGFHPSPGHSFGEDEFGLQMPMDPATKVGQGHSDQWLAVLSQCGLPLDTVIESEGLSFTLDNWLRQAEFDVPRNFTGEYSWTLIALSAYRDTDYQWTGADGESYSTDLLLRAELDQEIADSVCGGTHRLIGIAMALNKRRDEDKPIIGDWALAERVVNQHIQLAKTNQNPDGSYSTSYLHRTGWTQDLGEAIGTTGHVLEFLAIAAPDATLNEPWVQRAAGRVCGMLSECKDVDLECGMLYHALHGLQEYRARLK